MILAGFGAAIALRELGTHDSVVVYTAESGGPQPGDGRWIERHTTCRTRMRAWRLADVAANFLGRVDQGLALQKGAIKVVAKQFHAAQIRRDGLAHEATCG